MGELKYSVEAARQLEALYMMRDVVAQPAWTLNWLHLSEGERIIDIGCGSGFLSKRQKEAVDRLETAIQLNPNHSFAWGALGIALVYLHEEEKAAEALRRAIRLSPRDPMLFYYIAHLGIMEYLAGRYEQALEWFEKANRENPNVPTGYRILAAAHAMLGNLQEARAAYEELDRRAPGITIAISVQGAPFADPADAEHFAEGWRRAGMPES